MSFSLSRLSRTCASSIRTQPNAIKRGSIRNYSNRIAATNVHFVTQRPKLGWKVLAAGFALGTCLTVASCDASNTNFESAKVQEVREIIAKQDQNKRHSRYMELLQQYPETFGPVGDASKGEIQLITDSIKMAEVEMRLGVKIGVVDEDKFTIFIRDAVIFPNGKEGSYIRILWKKTLGSKVAGVALMPIINRDKVSLILTYRHALRKFVLELPRGGSEVGEAPEKTAARELKEETGFSSDQVRYLGRMTSDSGITNSTAYVYAVDVNKEEGANPEESEAILGQYTFTVRELLQIMGQKEPQVVCIKDGKEIVATIEDPFLCYALVNSGFLIPKQEQPASSR